MRNLYFIICLIAVCSSCKLADVDCEDTNYTYINNVKSIIDNDCNIAGCHNSGSTNGDFTTYSKMQEVLENGEFENRVLVLQDMPRSRVLSFSDKSILYCWINDGFPEN